MVMLAKAAYGGGNVAPGPRAVDDKQPLLSSRWLLRLPVLGQKRTSAWVSFLWIV